MKNKVIEILDNIMEETMYDKRWLLEFRERIQSLPDDDWETLEDIIEDIGKRMCHAWLLYPNAWYWNLQDKWWWECKWETLVEVYKEFREELKRNWRYD